jgi:hypothetical protein
VATSHSHQGIEEKPGGAAAVTVYEQVVAERALESFLDWQERRDDWPAGWRENAGLDRGTVYLTERELAGLVGRIEAMSWRLHLRRGCRPCRAVSASWRRPSSARRQAGQDSKLPG